MIELIFTIVIIGIAFMTLPLILNTTNDSIEAVQESRGYYHALAKMQIITDKPWDENNTADFKNTGGIYYVLKTQEDSGSILECNSNDMRPGHYEGQNRRMCTRDFAFATPLANLGKDGETNSSYDDIDDFDGDSDDLTDGFDLNASVTYVNYNANDQSMSTFSTATETTSVKRITVSLRDRSGNEIASYTYYATNVGRPQAYIKGTP